MTASVLDHVTDKSRGRPKGHCVGARTESAAGGGTFDSWHSGHVKQAVANARAGPGAVRDT